MRLAIIGAGNVGRALAQAFGSAGHDVIFGVRVPDPGKPGEASLTEAAERAAVSILAMPFAAVGEVIQAAGALPGRCWWMPPIRSAWARAVWV